VRDTGEGRGDEETNKLSRIDAPAMGADGEREGRGYCSAAIALITLATRNGN
jgi:hypothetical protein